MMRPLVVRGANPLSAMVVDPATQTVTASGAPAPQTVIFKISGGTQPYTITSSIPALAATPLFDLKGAVYGFSVTVPPTVVGSPPVTVLYTITDAAAVPATVTATLNIL